MQLRSAAFWPTWSYSASNRCDAVRQQWDLSTIKAGRQVWLASSSMTSSWLTPGRLLLLFCAMNMLVYIDRGNTVPCKIAGKADHGHTIPMRAPLSPFWQAS